MDGNAFVVVHGFGTIHFDVNRLIPFNALGAILADPMSFVMLNGYVVIPTGTVELNRDLLFAFRVVNV